MPSRLLDNRIRELCAKAIAADAVSVAQVLADLRSALHEHAQEMRNWARQEIARRGEGTLRFTEGESCKPPANQTNE